MAEGPRRGRRLADAVRAPRGVADADRRPRCARAASRSKARSATSSKPDRRAGGRRQDDRRLRPGRHPGQQRRRHLGRRARRRCRSTSGRRSIDINLTGAFLFAQAAGREMLKRQYGRIINIASIAGHARVGATARTTRLRREQGRPDGPDARAGGVVGRARHPRQRDRARLLPLAAGRRRDRDGRSRASRRSARFRASATPAS